MYILLFIITSHFIMVKNVTGGGVVCLAELQVGDNVVVFAASNCRQCEYCVRGLPFCTKHWEKSLVTYNSQLYGISLDGG